MIALTFKAHTHTEKHADDLYFKTVTISITYGTKAGVGQTQIKGGYRVHEEPVLQSRIIGFPRGLQV